jgi:hypothetical protein
MRVFMFMVQWHAGMGQKTIGKGSRPTAKFSKHVSGLISAFALPMVNMEEEGHVVTAQAPPQSMFLKVYEVMSDLRKKDDRAYLLLEKYLESAVAMVMLQNPEADEKAVREHILG